MPSTIQIMHNMEVCRANVGAKDDNVFVWVYYFRIGLVQNFISLTKE